MTLGNAIAWDAKYAALYAWASEASGWTTRWADQDAPRPDYPYILLDITSTSKEGGADEMTRSVDLTRARDIKVTPTAADSQLYRVTINGTNFDYTSDSDATVAEICAGLTSAIQLGAEPVVVIDNATDIDIAGNGETLNPTTPRLFNVTTAGLLSWVNNDAGNEVEIRVTGSRQFVLNVQAFQRNTATDTPAHDPLRNAWGKLDILRASLGLPSVHTALRAADIAIIEEQPIIDLSEDVDDTILSRASMDVRLRTLSVLSEYTGYIADVSGSTSYVGAKESPITDAYAVDS